MGMMEDAAGAMRYLDERFPDVDFTYGVSPEGPAPGDLTVSVGMAWVTVSRYGQMRNGGSVPAKVSIDMAGDLSSRPKVVIRLVSADPQPLDWLVMALAFIEAEAAEACERVAAVVPGAWKLAMTQAP